MIYCFVLFFSLYSIKELCFISVKRVSKKFLFYMSIFITFFVGEYIVADIAHTSGAPECTPFVFYVWVRVVHVSIVTRGFYVYVVFLYLWCRCFCLSWYIYSSSWLTISWIFGFLVWSSCFSYPSFVLSEDRQSVETNCKRLPNLGKLFSIKICNDYRKKSAAYVCLCVCYFLLMQLLKNFSTDFTEIL